MNRRNFFKGLLLAAITPVALRFGAEVAELPYSSPIENFMVYRFNGGPDTPMLWTSRPCNYDQFITKDAQ